MITDTRPALTARWRELERRGWMFMLVNDFTPGCAFIYSEGPNQERATSSVMVKPANESSELSVLEWFEKIARVKRD